MNIIWLGHGSFRIEIEDQVLLIDPWINKNPGLNESDYDQALDGATEILLTHAHFDHTADVIDISKSHNLPVTGIAELANFMAEQGCVSGDAFNMGGTIMRGNVAISMVPASHSSSYQMENERRYMGTEAGFIIKGEGHCIYVSGDTGIMADMDWIADFYKPDIGILSAGGHYTMGMKEAAYAAKRYFNFKTVIPCHYKTIPSLAQSAKPLIDGLPDVNVIEPKVLKPISF